MKYLSDYPRYSTIATTKRLRKIIQINKFLEFEVEGTTKLFPHNYKK